MRIFLHAFFTIAVVALVGSPSQAAISDGLVEYWDFNGNYNAGVNASHNGTLTTTGSGSGTFAAGKFGQAIDLESSTNNQAYVTVGGDENDFDFASASMSFSMWYQVESLYVSWQALFGKGEGNAYRLSRQSGNTSLLRLVPGSKSLTGLSTGTWHHVAATFQYNSGPNTTTGTLYVDGVSSSSADANIAGNSLALLIGANPGAAGRAWDGMIDDVGVWNRALTSQEVADIYNSGTGASISSLIPEPSSVGLLGLSGLLLLLRHRR